MSNMDEPPDGVKPLLFHEYQLAVSLMLQTELQRKQLLVQVAQQCRQNELMAEVVDALVNENNELPDPMEREQEIVKPFVPKPSKRNKFDRLIAINNGLSSKRNKSRQLSIKGNW